MILEKKCDIIILAEYEGEMSYLHDTINLSSRDTYKELPGYDGCEKIKGLIKSKYRTTCDCTGGITTL